MCLQPPWTDTPCARAAATGALSPRDFASWSCTKTQIRRPAECAAWPSRVMTSLQDCILQEPRFRAQQCNNSRQPSEGMCTHLLLCSRHAWRLYPHIGSMARKAGLTIRNRPRRSNTSSCECTAQSQSCYQSRPKVKFVLGISDTSSIELGEETAKKQANSVRAAIWVSRHSRSVSNCANVVVT